MKNNDNFAQFGECLRCTSLELEFVCGIRKHPYIVRYRESFTESGWCPSLQLCFDGLGCAQACTGYIGVEVHSRETRPAPGLEAFKLLPFQEWDSRAEIRARKKRFYLYVYTSSKHMHMHYYFIDSLDHLEMRVCFVQVKFMAVIKTSLIGVETAAY